ELTRSFNVIWMESLGWRRPRLGLSDARRILAKVKHAARGVRQPKSGLTVATPLVFPYYGLAAIRNINARLLAAHVHAVARRCGFADYIALTTSPAAEGVLRRLKTLRRVYYCADDYATMPGLNASVVRDMEDRLLEIVDIVITTSRALYDLKRKQ